VRWGHETHPGYFAQDHRDLLGDRDGTVESWLGEACPGKDIGWIRGQLGKVLFSGDEVKKRLGSLSGGEAARLIFARLGVEEPNVLVLDEPTNHLDLESIEALADALDSYDGTVVLVSHDRSLLRTVCDGFLRVADGEVIEFDGDVDDYLAWLSERRMRAAAAGAGERDVARNARRAQREDAAATRRARLERRRPLVKEASRLERVLAELGSEKETLEARLADPEFYASSATEDVHALARRCADVARALEDSEERWLGVQAELDALGDP